MPVFYSPEGNPEIWAQKPDGYLTPEEWAAAHPASAPVPPTEAELFQRLRTERDFRLAATDYLLMPDYPLSDDQRTVVQAYRQDLRDLPAQPGAPWDGGGEATPWPEIPSVLQEQQGSSTSSVYTPGVV